MPKKSRFTSCIDFFAQLYRNVGPKKNIPKPQEKPISEPVKPVEASSLERKWQDQYPEYKRTPKTWLNELDEKNARLKEMGLRFNNAEKPEIVPIEGGPQTEIANFVAEMRSKNIKFVDDPKLGMERDKFPNSPNSKVREATDGSLEIGADLIMYRNPYAVSLINGEHLKTYLATREEFAKIGARLRIVDGSSVGSFKAELIVDAPASRFPIDHPLHWIKQRQDRYKLKVYLGVDFGSIFGKNASTVGGFYENNSINFPFLIYSDLLKNKSLVAHELVHASKQHECLTYLKCGALITFSSDEGAFSGGNYKDFFRSDELEAFIVSRHFDDAAKKYPDLQLAMSQLAILKKLREEISQNRLRPLSGGAYEISWNGSKVKIHIPRITNSPLTPLQIEELQLKFVNQRIKLLEVRINRLN